MLCRLLPIMILGLNQLSGASTHLDSQCASLSDPSDATRWTDDARGHSVAATRTVDGLANLRRYAYDLLDRLTTVVYPDGEQR